LIDNNQHLFGPFVRIDPFILEHARTNLIANCYVGARGSRRKLMPSPIVRFLRTGLNA
jgi:hypothetical protein